MILTNCAACAAPLAHTAPRCVRCKTRYCNATCQHDHWRRGHKQMCKKIHRGGNAEQYNADKKYKEAVAEAVEACADDTKGQTCFICTQALHWKTKEGLVRGCACRGTAGFAHVSCLAEQAKILVAEVEENNLGVKVLNAKLERWHRCSLCKQEYHGVVCCALGWACWKTYLGRPETDQVRCVAMNVLGNGLQDANHNEDALSVREAELATKRRCGEPEYDMLIVQGNLASAYQSLNRYEEAMCLRRDVYSGHVNLLGDEYDQTLIAASNYASVLVETRQLHNYEEAKTFLCKTMPVAQRVLGKDNYCTLAMKKIYAAALGRAVLSKDDYATGDELDDLREATTMLAETARTARRVLGAKNDLVHMCERDLREFQAALRARETPPPR